MTERVVTSPPPYRPPHTRQLIHQQTAQVTQPMNLQALFTSFGALTDASKRRPTQRNAAPAIRETNLVKIQLKTNNGQQNG